MKVGAARVGVFKRTATQGVVSGGSGIHPSGAARVAGDKRGQARVKARGIACVAQNRKFLPLAPYGGWPALLVD